MTPEQFIEDLLQNASVSGNQVLERRLADLTVWYYKNKGSIAPDNLAARQRLLEQTVWMLLEINALLLERLRERTGSKNLFLPSGIRVNGDLREFG